VVGDVGGAGGDPLDDLLGELQEGLHVKNQDGLELNQGPLLCINRFNSLNLLV
jgi:hypothetical protein